MAVFSKLAAKFARVGSSKRLESSKEGKVGGTAHSLWTARRTAVFRPEKLKSRGEGILGWWKVYLFLSPDLARALIEGPPG